MKLNVERRFFAFLLAIVLILPILPLHVFAVEHLNTTVLDGKIKVYTDGVSGQGSGKNEDGTITVTTTATVKCSGMSYSYTANAHTIWVENNTTDETLMVDFDYEATRLGSLTIDGVAKNATPSGNCSKSLAPGEKIEIVITSPATGSSNSGATSTINLSNFTLKDTSSKSVTVVPATGGTIKVNGTAITANKTVSTDYATGVTLVATPASGYAFIGWGDTAGNVLATTATYLHQPLADITISALFAPKSETTGYWLANGKVHNDLNEACAAAQVGDKMVVLLKDATLPAGTYTIPADVYVIIPHNEANDFYGKEPPLSSNGKKWTAPTLYRTLTLAKDAKLVINGTLELPAQHHVSSGSSSVKYGGAIDGAYSLMLLSEGSNVTVNGTLYAWGMISGAGTVDLYGTAYEKMQVNDYRGGAATSALVTTYGDNKLFPFSQYYVQNIESKMTIYYGASLNVNAGVYLSAAEQASVEFVGDTGMFQLAEGSYVTKQYDAANDRLVIDLYGNASLSSITLYFGGQNVNSSGFRMGINNNISIHVHSGVTTISQELVLQPGVQVTIDRTATLYNTTNVFVMDAEDWGTFARGEVLMPVKWTYANGATVKRTSVTDAIVDINGIVINGGQLFSTGSDSIISSGKTGVYALLVPATGSATLYQLDHNSFTLGFTNNWVTISCTSAVLVNGDKTTVKAEGSQYDAFIYDSIQNKWVQKNIYNGGAGYTATLTYDVNGGTGSVGSTTMDFFTQAAAFMGSNYTAMAPYSFAVTTQIPTHPNGYTFLGWSTDKDADVPMYGYQGDEYITISADSTLYAVWGIPKFEITWIVNGETYIVEVESGKTPEYPYGTPTKSSDSTNHYTFTGWNTPPVAVTGPATYTAVFSGEAHDKDKIEGGRHYCSVCNYNMGNCSDTDPTDHMCDNGGEQMVCCADYLTPTDGKDPTCTEAGWKDYYTCSCGKLYADAEAKTEITLESWKTGDGKLDMSGHKGTIVYTNNGETHSAVYSECGCVVVTGEAHSYENGECVCDKVQTFTVTWIADGKTVDTETVEYGKNTTKNPTIPAKAGYSAAWDKTATNVTSNVTITAVYTVNEYTITWVVDGKSTTETYAYGATPSFKGSTDKAADAQYTYTFTGWDPAIGTVTGNATYTAQYDKTVNEYTITWVVDGKSTTETYAYGATPSFKGSTDKAADAQYTYTFTGWDPAIGTVTGNATYTAQYDKTVNEYTITWVVDGKTTTETYEYGATPSFKGSTDKAADAQYTYTFTGWDKEIATVTGNATYTAQYDKTVNKYTIKWIVDGVETTETYEYGTTPSFKGSTDKAADAQYTYTFAGWDKEIATVTGNATYTAQYDKTVNEYTITWVVDGKTTTETYEYGTTPSFKGSTDKAADAQYTYTFAGWDKEIATVTGNATYTAQYDKTVNEYTITWIVDGKSTTETYAYGATPSFKGSTDKTADAQYTYTFTGWDPAIGTVTGNATYTAQYDKTVNEYTITWIVDGKTTTETYAYGATPSFKGSTDKTADAQYTYTFAGWDKEIATVTGNATYTAQYDKTVNEYTITWVVDGKSTTETYAYGATPSFKGSTDKTADAQYTYTFAGWDKEIATVTGNATYTAQYDKTVNEYTITWVVDGKTITETYAYGATPSFKGSTDKAADAQYTYTFTGWDEDISEVQKNVTYTAIYSVTGFVNTDIGYVYKLEDEVQKTGWTEIGDAWYYLDHTTGVRAEGVTRVPYPTVEINGITYACPETDASDKFIDYSSALFVFDADGKFQQTTGIIYDKEGMPQHYAVNGMIPWHYGLATDGTDYYYFIGDTENGGNKLDSGDVYLTKSNNLTINGKTVIFKGVYTFGADGKLCFYDGVTKVGEDLRYYYDYCYTAKSGLIAVEDHGETKYIYVRSSTAKLVANAEYWVPANVYNIVPGYYVFSADGYLTGIEYTTKNGIFYENGGYYYYVDGAKYYAGLIQYNGTASDGTEYNDAYIYVRSNGQLAIGQYWITRSNGLMETKTYLFNECGIMDIRDGIVEENGSLYFYVDGVLAKGKGLVKIDENYYYVRSSGEVVNNSDYWITNTNEYDIVAKIYTFDENGVMIEPESKEADLTGVVDGYYFINGEIQYGVGPIIWEGNIYYVRSNGMVATGKYWTTTSNEILPSGRYTFDETGKLITE